MADDSQPKTETQPEATTDDQTPTTEPQAAVENKTNEGDGEKQNDTVQAPVTGEEAKNEKVEATETVKNEKEGGAKPSKQKDEKPRKNSKPRSRSNSMNRGATSKEWKPKGGEASKTLATNSTISADAPPFVAKGTHDHSNDHAAEAIQGHVLQTPWTFWFSKKNKSKGKGVQGESEAVTQAPEKDGEKEKASTAAKGKKKKGQNENNNPTQVLTKVGTVQSVEEFWTYYSLLQRPSGLPKESNYCFFRYNDEPLWETYPKGCCFIVRLKKNGARLNQMWEELLFAAIGEAFDEPNVVGVVVSIRSKEDALSVWTRSNNKTIRTTLGEKLKELLELDRNSSLGFKTNQSSMKDKSTYKNAKKILLAS